MRDESRVRMEAKYVHLIGDGEQSEREHGSVPADSSRIPPGCELITPWMVPLVALDQQQVDAIVSTVPGGTHNVEDIYPLSPLQEGMLFHYLLSEGAADTYVLSTLLELQSQAQIDTLVEALQNVMNRHAVLRSAVLWEKLPQPVQVVYRFAALPVEDLVLGRARPAVQELQDTVRRQPHRFDLRRAPLLHLQLAADHDTGQWYAALHVHHLICDHQSLRVVIAEAMMCAAGRELALPQPIPFRNHVAHALEQVRFTKAEEFFRGKLQDVDQPTAPFGLLDVHGEGRGIDEAQRLLDRDLSMQIRERARHMRVGVARLFHVAWALVVAHTSVREDVIFGAVLLASRQRGTDGRRMVGMSVNTLPLRLRIADLPIRDLVAQTDTEISQLLEYEHVPLTTAQRCSAIDGAPLFTSILNFRRSLADSELNDAEVAGIRVLARVDARTNYPITLTVDNLGEDFALTAHTDRRVDPNRVLGYLETALRSLTDALAAAPQTPALALPILPSAEREQLMRFNGDIAPYSRHRLIHELFEEQVARTPDQSAVTHEGQTLTYRELNARANQLARHLQRMGIGPDQVVGMCVDRSLEMVVGVLGILKAGGAYLPLDPSYPAERLEYMLRDAAPSVVLTQHTLHAVLPKCTAQLVALDGVTRELDRFESHNLASSVRGGSSRNLLYLIYTSGSTGRPKGTAMPHCSMVNLIEWHRANFSLSQGARVLQFAALSFDVAFQETFSTLCGGGVLVLLDEWIRKDARALLQFLVDEAIERLYLPPLMLQSLAECAAVASMVPRKLRDVITAGEQLRITPEIVELFKRMEGCRLHNHYGPTETHVVTALTLREKPDEWPTLPSIGRPISNTQVHIRGNRGTLAPIGVPGEIYIGGANVARGYLNRPDLTEQRFVADPFSTEPGAHLYKTGDLGCWRADGTLEYLGRNDDQVKIRGFRVELGEIEARLAAHELVKDAAVIAREDGPGGKRLVAYITPCGDVLPSAEQLRVHAKQALPEFMVPSAFVVVNGFPLTPSGKLNRRALPAPDQGAYVSKTYRAPQGEIEEILAGIWQSLLRVERVGRQDNFFELGGHSLLIVQLKERLRRAGLSTELRSVFESPTLAELAGALKRVANEDAAAPPSMIPPGCAAITPEMLPLVDLDQAQLDTIVRAVPGGAANVQDIYPLGPLQEGILFHHLLNAQGGDTYLVFIILSLVSRERLDQLVAALQAVVDRHDILRTAVLWEELSGPVQVVCRSSTLPVEEFTLAAHRDPMEQIREHIRPERQHLDLRRAPLMRLQVAAHVDGQRWYAVLQLHHMTIDHVAIEIITTEVAAQLQGRAQQLAPPLPYRNHVVQALEYARTHDAEAFFRSKLADVDEPTAPFGLLDVYGEGTQIAEAHRKFEPAVADRIRAQARHLGVSAATLFHAAWGLVVAHTSARTDVVFGDVLLGRLQGSAGAQLILGIFINTLPLRLQLEGITAQDLVHQTQRELIELLGHEQASLAVAQRCSGTVGTAPLFTSLLNYRHNAIDLEAGWASADGVRMLALQERTNYPIIVNVDDFGDGFGIMAQTDQRIDAHRLAGYLYTAVQSLVAALESAPQTAALALSILPEEERRQLVEEFNATQAAYPANSLLHECFEEQVTRTPNAVAVIYEGALLTYEQLNARANQLARHLRTLGVEPDQLVAICVERSLEMIVGLLGILKAGGAYVPLDASYPTDRIEYMLTDSAPRVLLTQRNLRGALPKTAAQVVALDADWGEVARHTADNLSRSVTGQSPSHLAYVIYTSGSTGKPKGAMNEHRAVINRLHWMQSEYLLTENDRVLQKTPFSFDVSVWEFFWTLLSGARLIVARPNGHQDPEYLRNLIVEAGVTTLHFVPSMLQIFLEQHDVGDCTSLRHVVCSGEELPASLQRKFHECLPDARLSNLYGPTEAAVDVTFWECRPEQLRPRVPIGRPIANVQMYVLDRNGAPTPFGVPGEVYIGGVAVGRGYWNRPELTAERFVPDPFSADPQARMYKTGDLGCWNADGAIEYLGRNDQQVKIRGFRIELGEIEAQLARHQHVKEAVVVAREDTPDEKRLVAYVVPHHDSAAVVSVEDLRAYLKAGLPDYMVPSAFVALTRMPLSPNGKLDRRALPAPNMQAFVMRTYEAPHGQVEEVLAAIWQSLLRVERIGRHDNFFELGGHSLLIVQMMQRLRRAGLTAEVRRVFESPTLAELARTLTSTRVGPSAVPPNLITPACGVITPQMLSLIELRQEQIETIVRCVPGGAANVQDIYPLAPLQEGILFHHLFDEERGDAYVLPLLLALPSRASVDRLIEAVQTVVDRHDVLRTAVLWQQLPRPVQVVYRRAVLPVEQIALDPQRDAAEQLRERAQSGRQRLNIRRAPMMRVQVAEHASGEKWFALLQLHHMTVDHVTLEMLTSEIVAHLRGDAPARMDIVPYRNHVAHALAYARSGDAVTFFRSKLADVEESTAPFGLLDVHGDGSRIEEVREELPQQLGQSLRMQARRLSLTAATLFHAAWGLVVACTSGRDDVVFGSVLLGRLGASAAASQSPGMFINTLPVRMRLQGVTVSELLEQTQRELVHLLGHEQASLAVAQQCSAIVGSGPLFTTLLNYRHSIIDLQRQWAGAVGIDVLVARDRTNYPIAMAVDDLGEGFALTAQTDRSIDARRLIAYFRTALQSLVEALMRTPQLPALSLAILPDGERQQLLEEFNATQADFPEGQLIQELFEEQVARTPNATAVSCNGECYTYRELNARANQLARHLRQLGVGPDKRVAICVDRSSDMLVGVLGTLKAGGAYVPIDPNQPPQRLQLMLRDSEPQLLLLQERLRAAVPQTAAPVVALDGDWAEIAQLQTANLDVRSAGSRPDHLAYVIYTSGSTGHPKGVMIEHRQVTNLWSGLEEFYERAARPQRVALNASFNFDASVQQLVQLLSGRTIFIVPEECRRDAALLLEFVETQDIEAIDCTPAQLKSWVAAGLLANHAPRLRLVLVGGEAIDPQLWTALASCHAVEFVNVYGPTECAVDATAARITQHDALPHIGRPMQNRRVYVLDQCGRPAPIGVAGEIHIGGVGVGRGYLNRPDLTAERFIHDPFSALANARMYKTGDLGRRRVDGTIEYLGRNDAQVKIRGYRIELGEIEAQLLRHPAVDRAIVTARDDMSGEKRLVAYVIPRGAARPSADELREHLTGQLPQHMLPSAFVVIQNIPLTSSGKIDRRALPPPPDSAYAARRYEPPIGETEAALARIWQELLEIEQVGRQDNFFDLGGHSLLVLAMLSRANSELGCSLKVADVYGSPILRELATRVHGVEVADALVDLRQEAVLDPSIVPAPLQSQALGESVFLTGATGFVGRFLLAQLLQQTEATLYCLVRAETRPQALLRLKAALAKWGLWRDQWERRIVAVAGDLRLPRLGIDAQAHDMLCHHVDSIYHCGTSMNHLETYAMARPANVDSVRGVLELATQHQQKVVNFISTLSVFSPATSDNCRRIGEHSPIDHEKHFAAHGYTASKWVGEKLIAAAADRGIACNVFRLGLVWADTQLGRYDELQREYRILKTSLLCGYGISDYGYPTAPTPVDHVARSIVFLGQRRAPDFRVFHIASSAKPVENVFDRWNRLLSSPLELLPLYDWIQQVKRLHYEGCSLPVVPLIEFAFSMDRKAFTEYQRRMDSARTQFDNDWTRQQLEVGGIVAPELDDVALEACLAAMLARDAELHRVGQHREIDRASAGEHA